MNLVTGLHRAKVLPLQETLQLGFIFIWLYLVSLKSISFHPPLLNPALKYNMKTLLKNSQDFSQVLPGLGEKKILEDLFFFLCVSSCSPWNKPGNDNSSRQTPSREDHCPKLNVEHELRLLPTSGSEMGAAPHKSWLLCTPCCSSGSINSGHGLQET